jgi:hypothetical protein
VLDDLQAALRRQPPQVVELGCGILIEGGDAQVKRRGHAIPPAGGFLESIRHVVIICQVRVILELARDSA